MPAATARLILDEPATIPFAPIVPVETAPLSHDRQPTQIATLGAAWLAARARAEEADKWVCERCDEAADLYAPHPPGGISAPFASECDREAAATWWRNATAIDALVGVSNAQQLADQVWSEVHRIADQLFALRPTTAADAAVKFGVMLDHVRDCMNDIDDPKPVFAFMADLEHLAGLTRA